MNKVRTEMRNPLSTDLDKMSTAEIFDVMTNESLNAVIAVQKAKESIVSACDLVAKTIENGGRLIYIGAGTSGRLGVLDASECPPTFGVSPSVVVGIIAGGDACLRSASENAEDNAESGKDDLLKVGLTDKDVVCGISVNGNAQYVLGALSYAKEIGAKTLSISSNPDAKIKYPSDVFVFTDTGEEVLTGSTRLKAGTAQKTVLNMLTTVAFVKNGCVYENLMINLKPSNIKLKNRVVSIVCDILSCDEQTAVSCLDKNDWNIRKTIENCKK